MVEGITVKERSRWLFSLSIKGSPHPPQLGPGLEQHTHSNATPNPRTPPQLLTLICIVLGLQLQLAGLKLTVLHLDL